MKRADAIAVLEAAGVPRADAVEALDNGIIVEIITLTGTGGPHGKGNRDGGSPGDGRQVQVKAPNGVLITSWRVG